MMVNFEGDTMAGNYVTKVMRMVEDGIVKCGEVSSIQVLHDDWCAVHMGKDCNCDPDIEMRKEEDCVDTINPCRHRLFSKIK